MLSFVSEAQHRVGRKVSQVKAFHRFQSLKSLQDLGSGFTKSLHSIASVREPTKSFPKLDLDFEMLIFFRSLYPGSQCVLEEFVCVELSSGQDVAQVQQAKVLRRNNPSIHQHLSAQGWLPSRLPFLPETVWELQVYWHHIPVRNCETRLAECPPLLRQVRLRLIGRPVAWRAACR